MTKKFTFEDIRPELISLGFAFYGEPPLQASDPERTLLHIVELFETERKCFLMLLAWLEKARELVHVERLKALISELDVDFLPVFGALCLKQVKSGDRRFAALVTLTKREIASQKKTSNLLIECDPYLVSKHGVDKEFLEFGIHTALIAPSLPKKILTLDGILKNNQWLRMRTLIGPNFRADIAYLMTSKIVENAYQGSKLLGCNVETSYRLWKTLAIAPDLIKLAS